MSATGTGGPILEVEQAAVRYGAREVWRELSFSLAAGEFLAVIGPNGSGKTTLLRVLLGLEPLSAGTVRIDGAAPHRGSSAIGYVPQQRAFAQGLTLRGWDLVSLGLDGHRFGPARRVRAARRRIAEAIDAVGASSYALAPVGSLSGGEQQRLRVAQALVAQPKLLLCDEPLLSLDPGHQQAVTGLIDERRRATGAAVVFVTHEVNPVLPFVDKILYLANRRFVIGASEEVLSSERLSDLYGAPIEVVRAGGRVLVLGAEHGDERVIGEHHHLEPPSAPSGWLR